MIELTIDPYCQNCPEFEPDVDKNVYTLNSMDFRLEDPITKCDTTITCKHKLRCKSMMRQLKKEQEKNDKT
jgi:hypothetical protein